MYILFNTINWFVRYYPNSGPIQRLFFASRLSEQILKISWDVILIDCIYITNHYHILLYMISGVTGLNTSFFIGFTFISSKIYLDYHWVLSYFYQFYHESNIPDLIIVGTNCEKALVRALDVLFLQLEHGLCFWHVDKNVLANCKSSFDIEKTWQAFYDDWHKVLYANTKVLFKEK